MIIADPLLALWSALNHWSNATCRSVPTLPATPSIEDYDEIVISKQGNSSGVLSGLQ